MRIHDNWESLPASLFMEYKQTGDRNRYQNVYFKKRSQLTTLAMGELLEGKGRFILPLINGYYLLAKKLGGDYLHIMALAFPNRKIRPLHYLPPKQQEI